MSKPVTEVVIYRIKADQTDRYPAIAQLITAFLQTRKGFISRKIMQDHQDKTLYMDLVEWAILVDAQTAMQVARQEVQLVPFFDAIEQVITSIITQLSNKAQRVGAAPKQAGR